MAGIRAGADCIHTTVNGMGERAGIPDLAETILAFHNLEGAEKFNIQPLMELSGYLEKVSGFLSCAEQTDYGSKRVQPQKRSPYQRHSQRPAHL